MPALWNTNSTITTDSPAYQRSMCSDAVQGGVDERVGFGVLLPAYVSEVDVFVLGQQSLGPLEVRTEVRLLHAIAALELANQELRVDADARPSCRERASCLERGDERAVFGHVVRRHAD